MNTLILSAIISMGTVTGGCIALLAVMLVATRSRRAPAVTVQADDVHTEPAPIDEAFESAELLVLEPEMVKQTSPHDSDSIIISDDYEEEARPVREPIMPTPIERPAVPKAMIIEAGDDSFEQLFTSAPAFPLSSLPRRDQKARDERLTRRLKNLSTTSERQAVGRPLPMPVPPPDLEPIPELEPTELIIHRPEWAQDWP